MKSTYQLDPQTVLSLKEELEKRKKEKDTEKKESKKESEREVSISKYIFYKFFTNVEINVEQYKTYNDCSKVTLTAVYGTRLFSLFRLVTHNCVKTLTSKVDNQKKKIKNHTLGSYITAAMVQHKTQP